MDLDPLRTLVERGDSRDRAFVDAMIRMGWSRATAPDERAALEELHGVLGAAALRSHASLRARIAAGVCRGAALRALFDAVPSFERDHFVEEVLGIAYPPLEEPPPEPELVAYTPSGYGEIVHAFDTTGLAANDRFLDIGSGTGKAAMLASLLAGATSSGIERDAALDALATRAAAELGLGDVHFARGDAREAPLAEADVVFMYLPFTGSVLARVMARLIEDGRSRPPRARGRFLCAAPLDLRRYDCLAAAGPPRSWLQVYAWR